MNQLVLVLDFGGQYKELIARATRELHVYSEVKSGGISVAEIKELNPIGIILTGGPNNVYAENALKCDPGIFSLGVPVLGICYGMQLMCHVLGGKVGSGHGEFGKVFAELMDSELFQGVTGRSMVLMSHSDSVERLPVGFKATAETPDCPIAACENPSKDLYGVQFHPETEDSSRGSDIIRNFLFSICGAMGNYRLDDYVDSQITKIRKTVGKERVLLALSGGVDSAVCATLLSRAVPNKLYCIFVDHGFMRLNEGNRIQKAFAKSNLHFIRVNAEERFLDKLRGITDPEAKRKLIGAEFAKVFEEEAKKLNTEFLAQGTIYPDIIESGGEFGATIKSHHNVGGLPKNLAFKGLVEPLSGLFKNEVRELGIRLGLPKALIERQPFPGPGLAVRIIGEVTKERLDILRRADDIFCCELDKLRNKPQQYFAVFTSTRSVGVKGDSRTFDYVIALRAVRTNDFMTCDYSPLPHNLLSRISSRITSEIPSVSRVVYDISSKPPATIEWE